MRNLTVIWITLLAVLAPGSRAAAQTGLPADADSLVRVTYLAGDLVYVDAGRVDGLEKGMRIPVERDGAEIALLEVRHLASKRASCVVAKGERPRIGDLVDYRRIPEAERAEQSDVATGPSDEPSTRSANAWAELGLRGRLGARYLTVLDQTEASTGFSQPALDMRLAGDHLKGGPISIRVDARARRTYRTRADGASDTDGRTRVYRMNASYQARGSRIRATLGRQVSPDLASVSLFDGALVAYEPSRWTLGAFAGTQPDPVGWGFDTEIVEAGGYARYRSADGSTSRWAVTGGAVASQQDGVSNRDYLFLRGLLSTGRLFGYLAQEVDVNRGWKADAGEPAFTATSTYASLRYRMSGALEFGAGYDNRRSVRLYRDRDTPETEFDDSYRQGVRASVTVRPLPRLRLGLSGRTYTGSGANTESATLTTRLLRLTPWGLNLGTRHTRYTGPLSRGWMHVVTAGASLGRRHHAEIHAGRRSEDRFTGPETAAATTWYGADLDLGIAGGWYALLSVESTRGDIEKNDQIYTSLTYRF